MHLGSGGMVCAQEVWNQVLFLSLNWYTQRVQTGRTAHSSIMLCAGMQGDCSGNIVSNSKSVWILHSVLETTVVMFLTVSLFGCYIAYRRLQW